MASSQAARRPTRRRACLLAHPSSLPKAASTVARVLRLGGDELAVVGRRRRRRSAAAELLASSWGARVAGRLEASMVERSGARQWIGLLFAGPARLGAAVIFLRRCHLPSPRRSLFFLRHRHLPSAVAALSSSPDQASSSPDLASDTSLGARRGLLGVVTLPATERRRKLATREATERQGDDLHNVVSHLSPRAAHLD